MRGVADIRGVLIWGGGLFARASMATVDEDNGTSKNQIIIMFFHTVLN